MRNLFAFAQFLLILTMGLLLVACAAGNSNTDPFANRAGIYHSLSAAAAPSSADTYKLYQGPMQY